MAISRMGVISLVALVAYVAAENEPIEQPECDASQSVMIRYSSTSERLYLEAGESGERGGCMTLTQIFEARAGKAPLYAIDPDTNERVDDPTGTWLLTESLYVEDGITLNVSKDTPCSRFLHSIRLY